MRPVQQLTYLLVGALLSALVLEVGSGRLSAAPATPTPAAGGTCDSGRSVELSGSATINVLPDRALVKLGVESNGATPEAVQSQNMRVSQDVIAAARALGVAPRDISADYYVVEPVYDSHTLLKIDGYRIINQIAVTLGDPAKVSALLVSALKAGANRVVDVRFYTSELRRHRDEARALAMKAAGEKAQALAGAAGAQVGCVLSIKESTWSYYTGLWSGRGQPTQNVVQNIEAGAPPAEDTPLGLGKIAVRAEVQVSYSLQ